MGSAEAEFIEENEMSLRVSQEGDSEGTLPWFVPV